MGGVVSAISSPFAAATGALGSVAGSQVGGLVNGIYGGLGLDNAMRAAQADLIQGVNADQANKLYQDQINAIQQQNDFVNALKAQGALGMQSQTDLATALANQAAGRGPNPAQAALNQATQSNIANQAALMAGQRGASSNPALIARMAAMQGTNAQQQAIGQGATLMAQQQLAAQNQLQNLAASQIGEQQAAQNAYANSIQGAQGNILGAIAAQNNARVNMTGNMNQTNASITQGNQQTKNQFLGNVMGAVGSAMALAKGGQVPKFSNGGAAMPSQYLGNINPASVNQAAPSVVQDTSSGPQSMIGKFMNNESMPSGTATFPSQQPVSWGSDFGSSVHDAMTRSSNTTVGNIAGGPDASDLRNASMIIAAKGGKIPIHGESYANAMEPVPGKAKVKGDSYANDTVDAKLSPGEIIIPRSIAQSDDPVRKSAEFVAAVMRKKGKFPKKD